MKNEVSKAFCFWDKQFFKLVLKETKGTRSNKTDSKYKASTLWNFGNIVYVFYEVFALSSAYGLTYWNISKVASLMKWIRIHVLILCHLNGWEICACTQYEARSLGWITHAKPSLCTDIKQCSVSRARALLLITAACVPSRRSASVCCLACYDDVVSRVEQRVVLCG